ncbi:MAG: chromate transporter [Acidobacteria bacterium]|nr:chromate transporter [Acidobacteriota bacterium]
MNPVVLYLLLLKATMTSFSGLASLPVIHGDLVERYHVLTERQLNTAVAAGRTGPGPVGLYIVNAGYLVAGVPGAIAGWLAMVTPAFLVAPLLRFFSRRASHPRVRSAIRGVLLASAALLISSTIPLGKAALEDPAKIVIAMVSFGLLALTRIETVWVILGAAAAGALLGLAG